MSYPPQPGYGAPGGYPPPGGYGGPPASNGLATGALVTGLVSALCVPVLFVVAIPLGFMGISKSNKLNGAGRGQAIGGLVAGFVGLAWTVLFVVLIAAGAIFADNVDDVFDLCGSDDRSPSDFPCERQGNDDPNPDASGLDSDPADQVCNVDRFFEDPDC